MERENNPPHQTCLYSVYSPQGGGFLASRASISEAGCAVEASVTHFEYQLTKVCQHLPENLLEASGSFRGLRIVNVPGWFKIYKKGPPEVFTVPFTETGLYVKDYLQA